MYLFVKRDRLSNSNVNISVIDLLNVVYEFPSSNISQFFTDDNYIQDQVAQKKSFSSKIHVN